MAIRAVKRGSQSTNTMEKEIKRVTGTEKTAIQGCCHKRFEPRRWCFETKQKDQREIDRGDGKT